MTIVVVVSIVTAIMIVIVTPVPVTLLLFFRQMSLRNVPSNPNETSSLPRFVLNTSEGWSLNSNAALPADCFEDVQAADRNSAQSAAAGFNKSFGVIPPGF